MDFENDTKNYSIGKKLGYIIAYLSTTAILYFALFLTKRAQPVVVVASITLLIAVVGLIVKRVLK